MALLDFIRQCLQYFHIKGDYNGGEWHRA